MKTQQMDVSGDERGARAGREAAPELVWVALARAYRAMSARIEESFREAGLSLTDFMLLEALLHKGALTITEIQAAALLATGSMTAAVDRLEARGWLVRGASEHDRRARVLRLTAAGQGVIEAAYAQHRAQLRRWMRGVPAADRATTFRSLRALERELRTAPEAVVDV